MISSRRSVLTLAPPHLFVSIVGFWSLIAVISIVGQSIFAAGTAEVLHARVVAATFVGWYTWVPATYLALFIIRRAPIPGDPLFRLIPIHLAGAVLCAVLTAGLYSILVVYFSLVQPSLLDAGVGRVFARTIAYSVASDSMIYFLILGIVWASDFFDRLASEREVSSALATDLTEARLQALTAQLQPHFLYNSLNTVSMLVRGNRNVEAVELVGGLGELFRYMIETPEQTVRLSHEIDFVRNYLNVEASRFGDRISVSIDMEDDVADARVPYLLLQPIVENAVRHGVEPVSTRVDVAVAARRAGGRLIIDVADTGQGILPHQNATTRKGLSNTKARLDAFYREGYTLEMGPANGADGCRVRLDVPFQSVEEGT